MYGTKTKYDPATKIWYGPQQEPIFSSKISIGDAFIYAVNRDPDKVVQINDNNGVRLTNRDILERGIKIALNLQKLGIMPDDVIGIVARNSHNLAPLVIAAFFCGTPFNALDTSFDKDEMVHVFGYTKPKIFFCDDDRCEVVEHVLDKLQLSSNIYTLRGRLSTYGSVEDFLYNVNDEDVENFTPYKVNDGSTKIAVINCSSGTTGLPKEACLSHSSVLQGIQQLFLQSSDVILNLSPIHCISGLWFLIGGLTSGVTRIITDEPFSSKLMFKCFEKYKVTTLLTTPSILAVTLADPTIEAKYFYNIRKYICGGGMIPVSLNKKINIYLRNVNLSTGYGLTELGAMCSLSYPITRLGSVGHIGYNTSVKIIDDAGNQLGPNEDCEIIIKTLYKFLGYYRNPDETKNILDEDGWIHSGDIGHLDNDGYLYVVDRKKDVLRCNGFQFWPSEIENKILEIDGVEQVCVCGIPDDEVGDLPAAVIIKRENCKNTIFMILLRNKWLIKNILEVVYILRILFR